MPSISTTGPSPVVHPYSTYCEKILVILTVEQGKENLLWSRTTKGSMAVRCAPCAAACAHPESPLRVLRACARVLHPARILAMLRFSSRAPPAPAHYSTSYTSFAPALQLSAPVALSYSRKHMAIVPRNSSCNTLSISLHTFVFASVSLLSQNYPFSPADLPPTRQRRLDAHWTATAATPDLFTHHRSSS